MKYDVFISYRRSDGQKDARTIKSELVRRGYKVFLDHDALKNDTWDDRLLPAIESAPVFLIILSFHSLDKCVSEGDWVRRELEHAIKHKKQIIPVNPDGQFLSIPDGLPDDITEAIARIQHSDIRFGALFEVSIKKMIDERIEPYVDKGFFHRNKKIMTYVSSLVMFSILLLFGGKIRNDRVLTASLTTYNQFILNAEKLMRNPDSLSVSKYYLGQADSIRAIYKGLRRSNVFGKKTDELKLKLNKTTDSLFKEYKSQYEFHYDRYFLVQDPDERLKERSLAIEYIDRALQIRHNDTLSSMKHVLTKHD